MHESVHYRSRQTLNANCRRTNLSTLSKRKPQSVGRGEKKSTCPTFVPYAKRALGPWYVQVGDIKANSAVRFTAEHPPLIISPVKLR